MQKNNPNEHKERPTELKHEKVQAKRDALFNLYYRLIDECLVAHNPVNGKHRRHHEILYYVKASVFDTKFTLDAINEKFSAAD
ncbi:MAG: hypothetical protein LBP83_01610 [Dysgonamonadaceae bacterium]|jgi:hypothetical protein|nr:hypothetical protein [Dysgonamonadaceae bacterium]